MSPKAPNEETTIHKIADGTAPDTTQTPLRYAAYANRVRTIMLAGQRYVAYTSDIGESFRPVSHPYLIRGAYLVSWLYLSGDVANEGYKAYHRQNPSDGAVVKVAPIDDYKSVIAQRAIFQSIASMGLPAFTIHSAVRYSGQYLKNSKNVKLRTWGPIGLGLAIVPFLPYIFDEPVEHAVDFVFKKGFEAYGKGGGEKVKEL